MVYGILALTSWQIIAAVVLAMTCVGMLSWVLFSGRQSATADADRRMAGLIGNPTADALPSSILRPTADSSFFGKLAVFGKPLEQQSEYDRNQLAMRLTQAGFRQPHAVKVFLSAKVLMLAVVTLAAFSYSVSAKVSGVNLVCFVMMGAGIGFFLPDAWLRVTSSKRREQVSYAIPDSLDMLVTCVEAGLGLDAAIQRVGEEMMNTYPELAIEWRIAARETQMGLPRGEALHKMAERTNVSEMRSLVATLVQAEKFGTSISQTLRVQSDTMRIKRRQSAEERAAKTTVKLLFPLIFFIFPALIVVVMGPALIRYVEGPK